MSWLSAWELFTLSHLQEAIRDVHVKGIMYRAVDADIGKDFWHFNYEHKINFKVKCKLLVKHKQLELQSVSADLHQGRCLDALAKM